MVFAYPKYSAMGREEERKKEFLAIGLLFDVKPEECPCCHGRHIVRYGHVSSNGRGRYLCKDCHKTFCGSAGTLYYRGRIGQHGIISFAGSLVLNRTVRDSAKAAGVSKNTARRYRRILLLRLRKRRKSLSFRALPSRSTRLTALCAGGSGEGRSSAGYPARRKP